MNYKVESIFRDAKGRELRRATTFHGEEADARCALVEAHRAMVPLVTADPRIDVIASTVTGEDGETISTTDYADELGSGVASTGLMHEVNRVDVDTEAIERKAIDAVLTDQQKRELVEKAEANAADGIFNADSVNGGGVADTDSFPADGKGITIEGLAAPGSGTGSSQSSGSAATGGDDPKAVGHHKPQPSASGGHGTGLAPVAPARQGHGYGGSDILRDLQEAKDSMRRATSREADEFWLSPEAWDQLQRTLERDGMLPKGSTMDKGFVLSVPIYKNCNPGAPPIQVRPRDKRSGFAQGGLVAGPFPKLVVGEAAAEALSAHGIDTDQFHVYGHECKHIFIDEAEDIDPATLDRIKGEMDKHNDHKFQRLILGKWEDED